MKKATQEIEGLEGEDFGGKSQREILKEGDKISKEADAELRKKYEQNHENFSPNHEVANDPPEIEPIVPSTPLSSEDVTKDNKAAPLRPGKPTARTFISKTPKEGGNLKQPPLRASRRIMREAPEFLQK